MDAVTREFSPEGDEPERWPAYETWTKCPGRRNELPHILNRLHLRAENAEFDLMQENDHNIDQVVLVQSSFGLVQLRFDYQKYPSPRYRKIGRY